MIHEVSRTEELAERRRAHSVDHAGLEVEERRAWHVLVARGLVVKHLDAVKLLVVGTLVNSNPPCRSEFGFAQMNSTSGLL